MLHVQVVFDVQYFVLQFYMFEIKITNTEIDKRINHRICDALYVFQILLSF